MKKRPKFLIVEDEFTSRKLLESFLAPYGDVDIAVNGIEAIEAFKLAIRLGKPYDLICMDIVMPELDGHEALQQIRELEEKYEVRPKDEVKIIMITILTDPKNVVEAYYKGGATTYIPKPIDRGIFLQTLQNLDVI